MSITTLRRALRALVGAAPVCSALAAGACRDAPSSPPEPGTLTVRLVTPHTDDRAVHLAITGGTVSAVEAATPELMVLHRSTNSGSLVLVFGTVSSGVVARLQVPDLRQAERYRAKVVEVADARYALRDAALAGYAVSVEP